MKGLLLVIILLVIGLEQYKPIYQSHTEPFKNSASHTINANHNGKILPFDNFIEVSDNKDKVFFKGQSDFQPLELDCKPRSLCKQNYKTEIQGLLNYPLIDLPPPFLS